MNPPGSGLNPPQFVQMQPMQPYYIPPSQQAGQLTGRPKRNIDEDEEDKDLKPPQKGNELMIILILIGVVIIIVLIVGLALIFYYRAKSLEAQLEAEAIKIKAKIAPVIQQTIALETQINNLITKIEPFLTKADAILVKLLVMIKDFGDPIELIAYLQTNNMTDELAILQQIACSSNYIFAIIRSSLPADWVANLITALGGCTPPPPPPSSSLRYGMNRGAVPPSQGQNQVQRNYTTQSQNQQYQQRRNAFFSPEDDEDNIHRILKESVL